MAWTARVRECRVCRTCVDTQEGPNQVGGSGLVGSPGLGYLAHMCVTLHASPHILRDRFIPALHVRNEGDKEDTGRSLTWEGDSSSLQPWTEVGSLVVLSS